MEVGSFGKSLVFEVHADAGLVRKVCTPAGVRRDVAAAYEEHKVLGAAPRLEFLAPELRSVSMTVLLSASMGVQPEAVMQDITELVETGQVEQLILGGKNQGRHVLMKATEEWTRSDAKGRPISIQVSLEFRQYA
ncbi:phage tail protein [Megalodesulfovibrio paquesii]